jgi:hypothetical protein
MSVPLDLYLKILVITPFRLIAHARYDYRTSVPLEPYEGEFAGYIYISASYDVLLESAMRLRLRVGVSVDGEPSTGADEMDLRVAAGPTFDELWAVYQ